MDATYEYDVFVSYRHCEADQSWVHDVLVPRLEADGFRVCLDAQSFRLGAPVLIEMERAVAASRYTLVVLTQAYGTSNFTDLEYLLADWLGKENAARRMIVAIREDTDTRWCQDVDGVLMTDEEDFETAVTRLTSRLRADPDG